MAKKELILDIAGVLVTNFSPRFWQALSEEFHTPYETLVQFGKETREGEAKVSVKLSPPSNWDLNLRR